MSYCSWFSFFLPRCPIVVDCRALLRDVARKRGCRLTLHFSLPLSRVDHSTNTDDDDEDCFSASFAQGRELLRPPLVCPGEEEAMAAEIRKRLLLPPLVHICERPSVLSPPHMWTGGWVPRWPLTPPLSLSESAHSRRKEAMTQIFSPLLRPFVLRTQMSEGRSALCT